jgi:hypothetical protein
MMTARFTWWAISTTTYHVNRAVIMPARMSRSRISLGTSANKDFLDLYDSSAREFIIDRKDATGLRTLTPDDWIAYANRKYQIKTVESFEFDSGWVVTAVDIGAMPVQEVRSELQLHGRA